LSPRGPSDGLRWGDVSVPSGIDEGAHAGEQNKLGVQTEPEAEVAHWLATAEAQASAEAEAEVKGMVAGRNKPSKKARSPPGGSR